MIITSKLLYRFILSVTICLFIFCAESCTTNRDVALNKPSQEQPENNPPQISQEQPHSNTPQTSQAPTENRAVLHLPSNPQQLNPYNYVDAASATIMRHIFQPLINTDYFTYEMVPQLAKAVPEAVEKDGKIIMEMEIKEGAKWDNGTPVTGEDVAFSLKILKLPKADNERIKPYFEYIEDIEVNADNPRQFTLICGEPYMLMVSALEDLSIIPAYVYDSEGVLKNYTVKELGADNDALYDNEQLTEYAEHFNSPKFQNQIIVGSGPYQYDKWLSNQRVILKKKENWWGATYQSESHWFEAYPDELTFEIINDPTTAVVAVKGEHIDALNRINPLTFIEELKRSESFNQKYNMYTPTQFLYAYIGLNMRSNKFDDVRVRRAMRHIMDTPTYQDKVFYGLAEQVPSFIHPAKKEFLNPNVKPHMYDLDKAGQLMTEAGWSDSNGNGIIDKKIDGELVEFEVDFLYPNVAKTSEKAVLMFQESARTVGIKVNVTPIEFTVMLEKTKSHNFDMFYGIWASPANESDPKQIWHTDSYNGGSNYVGFGTPESDKLIDALRIELDKAERAKMYKRLQEIIDEEAPYVFMSATQNRVVIHNKFGKVKTSGIQPGYFAPSFQLKN